MGKTYADAQITRVGMGFKTHYAVQIDGEVLVERSVDPEHDACRAYAGDASHLRFWWGDKPGMVMPVSWGRARYTRETETKGPVTEGYRPRLSPGVAPTAAISGSVAIQWPAE